MKNINEIIDSLKNFDDRLITDTTIFYNLVEFGKNDKFFDEKQFPFYIDFALAAESTCEAVFNGLLKYFKNKGANPMKELEVIFSWCCLAGLGGAYKNSEDSKYDYKNLGSDLISQKGVECLDETVMSWYGFTANSAEEERIRKHIQMTAYLVQCTLPANDSLLMNQIHYTCKAMFDYGFAIGKNL